MGHFFYNIFFVLENCQNGPIKTKIGTDTIFCVEISKIKVLTNSEEGLCLTLRHMSHIYENEAQSEAQSEAHRLNSQHFSISIYGNLV